MSKNKRKHGKEDRAFHFINMLILIVFFVIVAYPLYFVIIASVSSPDAVYQGKVILFPRDFNLIGYEKTLEHKQLWNAYAVSIFCTVVGTLYVLAMTMSAGYALSVKQLYGRRVILFLITFTMYFGGGIIPAYFLRKGLGLLNTIWVMIIPCGIGAYNLMVIRSFLECNIPEELYDASQVDGCGRIRFFRMVVIPLSRTIIAIQVLFVGVGFWNDYMSGLMYVTDKNLYPLQMVLRSILLQSQVTLEDLKMGDLADIQNRAAVVESIKLAIMIVSSIPVLILYPFVQKHFVKGVMVGSVKG